MRVSSGKSWGKITRCSFGKMGDKHKSDRKGGGGGGWSKASVGENEETERNEKEKTLSRLDHFIEKTRRAKEKSLM